MLDDHVNEEDAYKSIVEIQVRVTYHEHRTVEPETRSGLTVIICDEMVNDAVYHGHYQHAHQDIALLLTAGQIPAP